MGFYADALGGKVTSTMRFGRRIGTACRAIRWPMPRRFRGSVAHGLGKAGGFSGHSPLMGLSPGWSTARSELPAIPGRKSRLFRRPLISRAACPKPARTNSTTGRDMTRIDDTFARLKAEGKKAFVAYVMAGDPGLRDVARDREGPAGCRRGYHRAGHAVHRPHGRWARRSSWPVSAHSTGGRRWRRHSTWPAP
jgi:hypothetical protein